MEVTYLGEHLRYTCWATRRTLEAVGQLTDAEFTRETHGSFGSVRGVLVHMFGAAWWWYTVLADEQPPYPDWLDHEGEGAGAADIADAYEELLQRYERLAEKLGHPGEAYAFAATIVKVHVGEIRKWQGVMNIVSHDTHHRAQIATLLRQMGHTPIETDLIYFYTAK
ncbi:MAG TPA: DinB family protein [Symbiobacteriaceae bacterium]|nr:DinB family protein [Symbiobacteriaceae bacterium]